MGRPANTLFDVSLVPRPTYAFHFSTESLGTRLI